MSEEIKMSDVWGWDSIPQSYGHYESFTINGNEHKGNFYGLLFCTEEAANAVSRAVRNHDQLVEENAQLKKVLEELTYHSGDKWYTGLHGDSDITDIVGDLLK